MYTIMCLLLICFSEIMSISNMLMYDGALQCGNQAVANDSLQVKLPDQQVNRNSL